MDKKKKASNHLGLNDVSVATYDQATRDLDAAQAAKAQEARNLRIDVVKSGTDTVQNAESARVETNNMYSAAYENMKNKHPDIVRPKDHVARQTDTAMKKKKKQKTK